MRDRARWRLCVRRVRELGDNAPRVRQNAFGSSQEGFAEESAEGGELSGVEGFVSVAMRDGAGLVVVMGMC